MIFGRDQGDSFEPSDSNATETRRRGCVRVFFVAVAVVVLLVVIALIGAYYYTGTESFAGYVRDKIEWNLEQRLGRDVVIGKLVLVRRPLMIVLKDVTIANVEGGVHPDFAHVEEIEIRGGVASFLRRSINIGPIIVRNPQLNLEIYPPGSRFEHNFPKYKSPPPSRYKIVSTRMHDIVIEGGEFDFLDMRHDLRAHASGMSARLQPGREEQTYEGIAASPSLTVGLKDFDSFSTTLGTRFLYEPGALVLRTVDLSGKGIGARLSGRIDPLSEAVYDLKLDARADLARLRDILNVENELTGDLVLDARLKGKAGDFSLTGTYKAPSLHADSYDLADLRGSLNITDEKADVLIATGRYGGGSISGNYTLTRYEEPYPMSIDLHYKGVSLEALLGDWGVEASGLRGAAGGELTYRWNRSDLLAGSGRGTAHLTPGAVAFGNARYPMPLSGSSSFTIDDGVIAFAPSTLRTPKSAIQFQGTLAIEHVRPKLDIRIESSDFSELDRVAYNFAQSTGKKEFELLGLGGAGTITGTVSGSLSEPLVAASIESNDTRYNEVLVGDATIDLRYDGPKSLLTFDRADFRRGDATMAMRGTIAFPERGPSPRFQLTIDANGWDVEEAMKLVNLDLKARGTAQGSLVVAGTPEDGTATFRDTTIIRDESQLRLNGDVAWHPGEGNISFDLDIGASSYPVQDLLAFLDMTSIDATGALTGTIHLEGPKQALEGAGNLVIRDGALYGEPVLMAAADIVFTQGLMRATHLEVQAPAGTITGQAEYSFADETFSYMLEAPEIDLSKVQKLSGLGNFISGKLRLNSTGAGTLERPEVVIDATLIEGSVRGVELPADAPPPTFYLAIRNGQLVVRGAAFNAVTIDGSGTVADSGELSGLITVKIEDLERFLKIAAPEAEIPARGTMVVELALGGSMGSVETIRVQGTVPTFDVTVSGEPFRAAEPIRFELANGRLDIGSLSLRRDGSVFRMAGSVSLVGDQRIDLDINGTVQAALLQIVLPASKAEGRINVAGGITGTLTSPNINGTAELIDAQVKLPGFPQLIDEITGTLVFKGERIEVDSLRATVGGGRVVAGGFLTLKGLSPDRIRLSLQGTDVSLRYFDGVALEGDFDLLLSGDLQRAVLQGNVILDRAVYYKDLEITSELLGALFEKKGLQPSVSADWQDNIDLRIHVVADDTLAIKNNLANVTASAELDIVGTLAAPNILGEISIDEGGKITFRDVDYRVLRGTVNFQNPFRIDPYFDVTAEARIQQYEITVNLSGTMERIKPSISSDPPVSDLTLLSLLGPSTIGQTGGLTASGGLNAGTSLLFQSVGGLIGQKIFPFVDTFRVDAGLEGSSTAEPTVTFEKQVSNDLRVIVSYNTINHRKNTEIIEWQVRPEWLLQFTRDQDQEYIVEARFRRRYEGYWGGHRADFAEQVSLERSASLPSVVPRLPRNVEPGQIIPPGGGSQGTIIKAIEFKADTPFDVSALSDKVALEVGDPLHIRDVQDSISLLYRTGDFRDIRVDSQPIDGGVGLTFLLSLNYKIGEITFDDPADAAGGLEDNSTVREGEVLSLSAVDRAATRIEADLHNRGYLNATVDPETRFIREKNRADVIFHVEPGALVHVSDIEFNGDLEPFTTEQLRAVMREKSGEVFRIKEAKKDADRIRKFLIRKNYRKAEVTYLPEEYDEATESVRLLYRVKAGPRVEVQVEGVPFRAVRRLLPFHRDEAYSEDLIDRAVDAIVERYQKSGHYYVTVDTEEKLVDGRWVVTFQVKPDGTFRLAEVDFSGNENVTDDELRDVVTTAPSGGFRRFVARLFRRPVGITPEILGDDASRILTYYRQHGFTAAVVDDPRVERMPSDQLRVIFPIQEGPQAIVRQVDVEGTSEFAADDLPDLKLEPGDPLNPQVVNEDAIALQSFYADRGYVEIQVSPKIVLSEDKTGARVTFGIVEGPKVTVGDVAVRGNFYTDRDVILRKIELKKGEPFSYRKILEAQQSLYRLGIFRRADIVPEEAGTSVSDRNIVVEVEEGKNLSVAGSVGYSNESGGSVSALLSHRNLFGTGRYLGLQGRYSARRQQYFLTFLEPFTLRTSIPTQFTVFSENELATDQVQIKKFGSFVELSKVFRGNTRWAVRYEYRLVRCLDREDTGACGGELPAPGIPRENQSIQISSLTPSFFWDTRNDPFNPHRGLFSSASIEYAFPLKNAEADFLKSFTQAAWYLPVTDRSEFVASARLGLIRPLAKDGPGSFVPFSERFFAGGETTHRAFALDDLGIPAVQIGQPDATLVCTRKIENPAPGQPGREIVPCAEGATIVPIGGNAMTLLNLEYRFPVIGSLFGATFVDAGNVWRDIGDLDLGQLRYGLGVGIRYLTPVGPIRVDFGYKLNREDFESPYAWSISLGFPF